MKVKIIISLLFLTFTQTSLGVSDYSSKEVVKDKYHQLFFSVKASIDDTTNHPIPHVPTIEPVAYLCSHTLSLVEGCENSYMYIIDIYGNMVFYSYIHTNPSIIELSSSLSGIYTLYIIRGNICFYTTLEL